jgi:hypothetical protein
MNRPASISELAVIAERIAGHEKECVERMRRIDERLAESKHDRLRQSQEMRDGFKALNRMLWAVASGMILLLLGVVGYLADKLILH